MNKSYYRDLFIKLKPVIKFNYFCKLAGVSSSSLSLFLKGSAYDHMVSLDKLRTIQDLIFNFMDNFA